MKWCCCLHVQEFLPIDVRVFDDACVLEPRHKNLFNFGYLLARDVSELKFLMELVEYGLSKRRDQFDLVIFYRLFSCCHLMNSSL